MSGKQGEKLLSEIAEMISEEIEAGNVEALGIVLVRKDNAVVTDFALEEGAAQFTFMGAIDHLKACFWNSVFGK